jgi:hypothetical protein
VSATVLVTVVGPGGLTADLALPAEVPIAKLLDGLRAALRGLPPAAPVALGPLGGDPLPPTRSLAACGVGDGAVLALDVRRPDRAPPRPEAAIVPAGPGRPAAGRPAPLALPARFSFALRAAVAGPAWRWSLARGRRAWRDGSHEQRLQAALAAAPLARCAVVGVVGAAPRAGATTVAALLAAALAARPGRAVAVDANPGRGSLTDLLAPCHDLFAGELLGLLGHPGLTRRELAATLARRGDLAVLAARPGAGQPDERGWLAVLGALARHATTVVVDCGPAGSPGACAALATADQFVLVADARSARPAAAASLLADRGRPPVLLVNRASGGLDAAEVVGRVPGARAAVLLPDEPAAAVAWVAVPPPGTAAAAAWAVPPSGAPLGLVRLPARWRLQVHGLAMLLAAEWPFLGPGAGASGRSSRERESRR